MACGQLVAGHAAPGNDHRTVAVAHAGAARAENVAVAQVGVGVNAHGRQFQLALEGAAIERLDVDQFVREAIAARIDFALGQGIEHEGVVGIGTVADADEHYGVTF